MCSNAIALYCVVWWVGGAATKTKWIPTDIREGGGRTNTEKRNHTFTTVCLRGLLVITKTSAYIVAVYRESLSVALVLNEWPSSTSATQR
jgi:hypothetical protein